MSNSTSSFWEDQALRRQASLNEESRVQVCPPLRADTKVNIAIIGGGFTGLSVAREIKRDEPGLSVAVLEARNIGYGASGRNGGFNMSLFGLEPEVTLLRWGKQRTVAAHNYMTKAVSYVRRLVKDYNIQSDYEHNGMVRVAYSDKQLKRLEANLDLFEKLGVSHQYTFKSKQDIRKAVRSPRFQAGVFEENSGTLNPYKHVTELKRIALSVGATIYENTPVHHIARTGKYITLSTQNGNIQCKKLVIAVNAWSGQIRGLPRIRSRQAPVWTSQVVTAPLTEQQWQDIGWAGRESIEDNRQLLHYFRRTACGRFTMGGGNIAFPKKGTLGNLNTNKIWDDLETHIKWLFPQLKNLAIEHRWGGPVSVNMDMAPEIGFVGDRRIIYANGCIGHGVSLTQLNGRTLADLVLEKNTELTDFWIINRKAVPWPPGIFGQSAARIIVGGLKLWDKLDERTLKKPPKPKL